MTIYLRSFIAFRLPHPLSGLQIAALDSGEVIGITGLIIFAQKY